MQIDRQFAIFFDRLLNPENVRKNLTFVVGRAAGKDISILQNGIEWRRIPQLQGIGRLHVVMSDPLELWDSPPFDPRSEEHTSELQSRRDLVCRLLLEKKKIKT